MVTGTYELVTEVDLTAGAVLPDPIASYLGILEGLRDRPADTLILLLDQAGVPLIDDLFAILPDALEDVVTGAIDDYVATSVWENVPVTDELDWILDQADLVLARFDLVTGLELPAGDAAGHSVATHTLRAIRLGAVELPIPGVPPPLVGESPVDAWVASSPTADAALTLGDHTFGLPYGSYAFAAFEELLHERYGAGLREALGLVIDCPALAAHVAGRCVYSLCVGHEEELLEICEEGLDEAEAQVRERFESIRFDAIRLEHGTAAMRDDRIDDGVWTASIDAGMGLRPVPATFSGLAE
jgi:hypothetical protein